MFYMTREKMLMWQCVYLIFQGKILEKWNTNGDYRKLERTRARKDVVFATSLKWREKRCCKLKRKDTRVLYFCNRALYSPKRALHFRKRALYLHQRALSLRQKTLKWCCERKMKCKRERCCKRGQIKFIARANMYT